MYAFLRPRLITRNSSTTIRITRGFHVCYSPSVTEVPGWAGGSGGITVRETHQAMEAIALNGAMISMSVSGLSPALEERVAADTASFVMSAFGKRIL